MVGSENAQSAHESVAKLRKRLARFSCGQTKEACISLEKRLPVHPSGMTEGTQEEIEALAVVTDLESRIEIEEPICVNNLAKGSSASNPSKGKAVARSAEAGQVQPKLFL